MSASVCSWSERVLRTRAPDASMQAIFHPEVLSYRIHSLPVTSTRHIGGHYYLFSPIETYSVAPIAYVAEGMRPAARPLRTGRCSWRLCKSHTRRARECNVSGGSWGFRFHRTATLFLPATITAPVKLRTMRISVLWRVDSTRHLFARYFLHVLFCFLFFWLASFALVDVVNRHQ